MCGKGTYKKMDPVVMINYYKYISQKSSNTWSNFIKRSRNCVDTLKLGDAASNPNSRNICEITQTCWAEKSHRPIWNSINIWTEGMVVFGYEATFFCREFPKITKVPRSPRRAKKAMPIWGHAGNVAFAHHSDDGNAIVRRFMKLPKWVCSKMRDPHPRTSSCNNGQ